MSPNGKTILISGGLVYDDDGDTNHPVRADISIVGETIPRETWLLNALPPNYKPRSLAELRARTLLGAVECLRAGITVVQDMVTLSPMDSESVEAVLAAYAEVGI